MAMLYRNLHYSETCYNEVELYLYYSPADLLHFKSGEIAEQMTLIDAELFQRIEVRFYRISAK